MKALAVLAGSLSLFAGTAAHAQAHSGAEIGRNESLANNATRPGEDADWRPSVDAEARLWKFAGCVVRNSSDKARWVLEAEPLTPDAQRRSLDLFDTSGCTRAAGTMKLSNKVLRWALAEQLYVASGPGAPGAGDTAAPVAKGDSYALGACVARRDPAAADAFVRSARRSAAEKAAFKGVIPAINACAGSSKLNLSGAEMHGVLAEGLYRMRGTAAQGSN